MKTAITGHTDGIGKVIYDSFPDCVGFSRSNGFDLSTEGGCNKFLNEIDKFDIFINNAFPYVNTSTPKGMFRQTELLYAVYDKWKDQHKLIINIGSNTTDGIKKHHWPYSAAKASLDNGSEQLCYLKSPCFVSNLRLGFVATKRIVDTFPDEDHIPVEQVSNAISYILNCFGADVRVKELCLLP